MKSLVPSSWGRRQIRSKAASSRSPLSPPLPPHQCQSFHLRFNLDFLLMLLFKLIFLLIGLYLHVFSFNPLAPPIGGAPSSKSALLGENLFKIKIQNSARRKAFQNQNSKFCSEETFSNNKFKTARRKAFENQNSKFLCPGQTTIILILVNLLVVIKSW